MKRKLKTQPMPGALAIVGKDANGRRMVLPVLNLIGAEALINAKSLNKSRLKSVFSTVMNKVVHLFSKVKYKEVRKKQYSYLTTKRCKETTESYLAAVNEKLQPLLYARSFSKGK